MAIRNPWRRMAFFPAFAAVVTLPGCRLQRDFPTQNIRVIGTSYNPGIAMQMIPPGKAGEEWTVSDTPLDRTVLAWGDADVPAQALDPLQGRLVAKQMAKQAARRKLARAVETIEVYPGRRIGEIIRSDPTRRRKVEEVIQKARQKALIKAEGGKYSVCLSLALHPLKSVFGLGPASAGGTGTFTVTAVTPQEFQQRAKGDALKNARIRALEYLKHLPVEKEKPRPVRLLTENRLARALRGPPGLPPDDTLGKRMLIDDSLDRAVRRMVDNATAGNVNFIEDGTCAVALDLDLGVVRRFLAERGYRLALPPIRLGLPFR